MAITLTAIRNKITAWLTNNNAKQISGTQMNEITTDILNSMYEFLTANGYIPFWDSTAEQMKGDSKLKFDATNKELQLQSLRLQYGQTLVNNIYNSGTFTGVASKTLVTKRYVDGRRVVVGTISQDVDLGTSIRVGQTVTLDGGISHTIEEGDTFLLKSQTDPAENVPYTAVAADAAPVVAEWYDATKNQDILIEKGAAIKQVMPAVEEGADPVVTDDLGAVAFHAFFANN